MEGEAVVEPCDHLHLYLGYCVTGADLVGLLQEEVKGGLVHDLLSERDLLPSAQLDIAFCLAALRHEDAGEHANNHRVASGHLRYIK